MRERGRFSINKYCLLALYVIGKREIKIGTGAMVYLYRKNTCDPESVGSNPGSQFSHSFVA